jgi:hypothetical protein
MLSLPRGSLASLSRKLLMLLNKSGYNFPSLLMNKRYTSPLKSNIAA